MKQHCAVELSGTMRSQPSRHHMSLFANNEGTTQQRHLLAKTTKHGTCQDVRPMLCR